MTMYVDGKLVWGTEPDGTEPEPYTVPGKDPVSNTTTTTTSTTTTSTTTTTTVTTSTTSPADDVLWGDTNCDGTVELADAILIMQSLANPDKYGVGGSFEKPLTEKGRLNGDVDPDVKGLTSNDALAIQEYLLHIIDALPKK